jgi:tetrahydromethanopterin S-methyltransferase subunit B
MEIFGLVAFVLIISYSSLPEEIKKLKQSVKKYEKSFNVTLSMLTKSG